MKMKRIILVLLGLNLCFVLVALGQDAAVVGREGLLLNLGGDIYIWGGVALVLFLPLILLLALTIIGIPFIRS